ncbi:MAG: bi-domain-containing oxidoreductase [Egibacteraceae bacterium]
MRVVEVPRPVPGPTEVLVQTVASVISAGTEGALTALARSSLLDKARARPDLVREVVRKARREGVAQTARAVRARLDSDVPLGYSAAGRVVEVGEYVSNVAPGDLVATAGAGKANHAEFQAVPGLLCARVPQGVPARDAASATIGAIALHGLRLAEVGPGAKVVVVGLGLVGQLSVRLAQASGCDVAGIDVAVEPVDRARASGALGLVEAGEDTTAAVTAWSRQRGVDAVLVTAATSSSAVMARVPALCRDRATVVVVGDVGLDLERTPFYAKELSVRFARSYGLGRYERSYEDWGVDYPPGAVRWTEGRNLEAVLDLMAAGRLQVADLLTHRFALVDAPAAYELVSSRREPVLGIALAYEEEPQPDRPVTVASPRRSDGLGVGFVGAGAFAASVLVPAFRRAGFDRFVSVASASGLSALRLAQSTGFERAVSGADAVIDDPDVDVVVVATPHDTHAALTARALRAGKHVFCEKPLALTEAELDEVESAWADSGRALFVGFNRRWSPAIARLREHFHAGAGPLVVTYRVNAGLPPSGHWYHDRHQGGRLIGEVCHFVDTCSAIVDAGVAAVHAEGTGPGERLLSHDVAMALRYEDGSLATISYASCGWSRTPKERIEVLGRGRTAVLTDFRQLELDGRSVRLGGQDKGHDRQVERFRRACIDGGEPTGEMLHTSRLVLIAASKLGMPTTAREQQQPPVEQPAGDDPGPS